MCLREEMQVGKPGIRRVDPTVEWLQQKQNGRVDKHLARLGVIADSKRLCAKRVSVRRWSSYIRCHFQHKFIANKDKSEIVRPASLESF